MNKGLLSLFTEKDFNQEINGGSYSLEDIVSISYVMNKGTEERFARAVLEDGTTLMKPVLARGSEARIEHVIPPFHTNSQRNKIIKELAEDPDLTQEMIATMLDISQSTVSNVLRSE